MRTVISAYHYTDEMREKAKSSVMKMFAQTDF